MSSTPLRKIVRILPSKRGHRGKKGHDGHQGPPGPRGAVGQTGSTGPTGSVGPTGPTGSDITSVLMLSESYLQNTDTFIGLEELINRFAYSICLEQRKITGQEQFTIPLIAPPGPTGAWITAEAVPTNTT